MAELPALCAASRPRYRTGNNAVGVMNPWAKHYQAEWENRAADTSLSLWPVTVPIVNGRGTYQSLARRPSATLRVDL